MSLNLDESTYELKYSTKEELLTIVDPNYNKDDYADYYKQQ
ncbi:MAG: hypothetical protein PHN31_02810 [Candidatus Gracilibacteria bacterium]|nr:hypothetical protein [Candidatus Gracilibacteria bacterium]